MAETKCPVCGCETFYVKNPEDEYDLYEFQCRDGSICFDSDVDASGAPSIDNGTETFCNACNWHGGFGTLAPEKS